MRRFRTIAIVAGITVVLDVVITLFIPASILDPLVRLREADLAIYRTDVPWHHEIKPNLDLERAWGGGPTYRFRSDQYGFATGECAGTDAVAEKDRTVFLIGDSFTEGLGLMFEKSFAGLLACAYRERGLVVRNLGAVSYAPLIYWRKVDNAVEQLGLKPREIVVFLDLSDIHNEAIDYYEEDGRVEGGENLARLPFHTQVKNFLRRNSMLLALAAALQDHAIVLLQAGMPAPEQPIAMWTVDKRLLEAFGRRGLASAAANLEKIVQRCAEWGCRLTLVVYPWPDQLRHRDRDSIQVRYWRDWAARHGVRFVDAFPPFFQLPAREAIERYYIRGDVHFNAAGSRLIADEVLKVH